MALSTTQVNQAFLATLGRPAEGSAAKLGASSPSLDALLDSIFITENTGDFVESLYTEFLGRASDAEGKAFWNSLLAATSKEEVLAQFKAAVIAAGQADPSNADYQGLIATNKAFVTNLYTNLLGREADAEGLEFWANALASGTSKGDLLAQFTEAAKAGGADNDDYQTITAKLAVADAFSAKFSAFNADVTAGDKKAALAELKTMMEGVVAGSTVEDIQEEIDQIAGNYQNRTSQVFTKDDDDLDASEATAATTFRGTVNLIDSTKGTIQAADKVSGKAGFTDTLVVNVTSDSTNKLLDLDGDLPASISDIEKLIVNNGSANVEGDLSGANFSKSVSITGTGDVNLKVSSNLEDLSVSSATKGDVAITVDSELGNYTGGNAGESVTVNGSIKKASLGAGDDTLIINGAVAAEGAIDLGAGNDELEINENIVGNKITLDGGAGSKDILTLNGALNLSGVKSIIGFETIDAKSNATISAEAANGLKAKLTDGSNLTVNASTGTTTINLSGLSVDKGNVASVALNGLTKETITLSKTVAETIDISSSEAKNITIKGFANGSDKLVIAQGAAAKIAIGKKGADLSKVGQVLDTLNDKALNLSAGTNYVAINTSNEKASYIWKVTKTDGVALTRDDITLVANVDKALVPGDFENAIGDGESSGGGTDQPITSGTAKLEYNETYNTLEVTQKISGATEVGVDETATGKVATAEAIVINAAGADISFNRQELTNGGASIKKVTVQSDANTTNTLDLSKLSDATKGAITTIADTAGNANFTLNEAFAALATVNLGAGTDTLTLGENFSGAAAGVTVNAGDGNDTINISAVAKAKLGATGIIDGGSGTDTVILNAIDYSTATATQFKNIEVITGTTDAATNKSSTIKIAADIANKETNAYTLNAIEINGDLTLKADTATTAIDASDLTDADKNAKVTIDLAGTTPANLTKVKGSASVKETISISGNFTGLANGDKVEGIEAIYGAASDAKLAGTFFTGNNANTSVKALGGTLEITYANNLNLSAITAKEGTGAANVKISGVSGSVTLTDKNAGIKDTVVLHGNFSGGENTKITGAALGDKIDLGTVASSGFAAWASKNDKITADNKAYYITNDTIAGKIAAKNLVFTDVFANTNDAKTAIVAIKLDNSINIYKASNNNSNGTITLLGTVDGVTDAVAAGNDLIIMA